MCVLIILLEQTSLIVFMLNEHSTPLYLCKEHVGLTKTLSMCVSMCEYSRS